MTRDRKTTGLRQAIIRVACHSSLVALLLAAGCNKTGNAATDNSAPPDAASRAKGFSSVEYYPEPNATQMKTRMSGADAQPGPGGLLVIKQVKLETFNLSGKTQAVVQAPECVYDTEQDAVFSAAHLQLQSGDGKIRTEGDGFLWQQTNSFLIISNNVHTVIKASAWKMTMP